MLLMLCVTCGGRVVWATKHATWWCHICESTTEVRAG